MSGEAVSLQLREPTSVTSAPLLLVGSKATGAQPPCLRKDGNVFQITDARMEILVARLDFSLAGCRRAGAARAALCEARLLLPTSLGKGVGHDESNTRMRNLIKPRLRTLCPSAAGARGLGPRPGTETEG